MRKFIKALLAGICSFLCVNFLCVFYYSAPGDVYRNNGATESIRMPDSFYFNAEEGHGIIHFDRNGYNNMMGELESSYILVMGSSHMEAIYVSQEQNTAAELNYLLGGTDNRLRVYNIAHAGNPFPDIIEGFQAGIGEFPNSSAVVIEIYSTSYPLDDLQKSLHQIEYQPSSGGEYLADHLTVRQRLRSWAIGSLPFIRFVITRQFGTVDLQPENPFGLLAIEEKQNPEFDAQEYSDALNAAFSLLHNEYGNPIIILYHPEVIFSDNTLEIVRNEKTYDIFKDECERNGLIFVDTGDAFLEAYKKGYIVPYGFHNTAMGNGHLNADGHGIVARELYRVIKDLPEVSWK